MLMGSLKSDILMLMGSPVCLLTLPLPSLLVPTPFTGEEEKCREIFQCIKDILNVLEMLKLLT